MHQAIQQMLSKYNCQSKDDYINALKEIIQEVALLGLWRAKFFEHAAFYGGTALRILYGLDRFSEDLDFSLVNPDPDFDISVYNKAIESELSSFGFEVSVDKKIKNQITAIQSAFIKANTLKELIQIKAPENINAPIPKNQIIKIKLEIDTDPPLKFSTENKLHMLPIPFYIRTYIKPDLFAGKMHAILCRKWKSRIKGRDWYDLVWYIANKTPLNLIHLKSRLVQSGHILNSDPVDETFINKMLEDNIEKIDFNLAKIDVENFLKYQDSLTIWGPDFFKEIIKKIVYIS